MTDSTERLAEPQPAPDLSAVRPDFRVTIGRASRLRCPKCGEGRLFRGWFRMPSHCPSCGLRYERSPGYFLGSAYINYGLTALIVTVAYFALHFVGGWTNRQLAPALATFCFLFPLFFFRYARSLWMGMDYWLDPVGFQDE